MNSRRRTAGSEKWTSYEARLAERVESAAGRIGFRVADYDVVEKFEVENACGFAELARYLNVGRTRGRIAGYAAFGITGVMPQLDLCRVMSTSPLAGDH